MYVNVCYLYFLRQGWMHNKKYLSRYPKNCYAQTIENIIKLNSFLEANS